MAGQERVEKSTKGRDSEPESTVQSSNEGERLKSDMDDLLDEIDEVLETNAEEFVKSYIQKGGQ